MIEGRFYRNRRGEKVGPLERNTSRSARRGYPWRIGPLTYDADGFWLGEDEEDEEDLLELAE